MTLSARIARAESRVPQPAPTVTVVRRFYTPCPVCRRHGGARVRHVRENDLAAPPDAWTAACGGTPDGGPPGCGALLVNRAAWDYYEWCEAHPPADPHAPLADGRGLVSFAEWADAWRTLKAHGHVVVVRPGRDQVTP